MGKKKKKEKEKKEGPLVSRAGCPVCGGRGIYKGKPGKDSLCECEGCGLIFAGDPPSRRVLEQMREERFKKAWTADWDLKIRKDTEAAQEVMTGYFTHAEGKQAVLNAFDRRVLDSGCGLGFRLREFQRYGWDVYGLDPSASAAEYARACFLDVRQGWLDQVDVRERRYDLVAFFGSLACLPDPLEAVNRLKEILRPKGLVFAGLAGEPVGERLFHFDCDSLRRLFMENGFQVLEEGKRDGEPFAWFGRKKESRARKATLNKSVSSGVKEV